MGSGPTVGPPRLSLEGGAVTTRGPMLFVVVARSRKCGGEMDSRVRRIRSLRWCTVKTVLPCMSLPYFNDRASCVPSGSVQVVVVTAPL